MTRNSQIVDPNQDPRLVTPSPSHCPVPQSVSTPTPNNLHQDVEYLSSAGKLVPHRAWTDRRWP